MIPSPHEAASGAEAPSSLWVSDDCAYSTPTAAAIRGAAQGRGSRANLAWRYNNGGARGSARSAVAIFCLQMIKECACWSPISVFARHARTRTHEEHECPTNMSDSFCHPESPTRLVHCVRDLSHGCGSQVEAGRLNRGQITKGPRCPGLRAELWSIRVGP